MAMVVDVLFSNLAFYKSVPEITLFQRLSPENNGKLVAWKVIKQCSYQRTRQFPIARSYSYQFFDYFGNFTPQIPLISGVKTVADRFNIIVDASLSKTDQVFFSKTLDHNICGINLLKNNQLVASQRFYNDNQIAFILSDRFYVCADVRVDEGGFINPLNLNVSLNQFMLNVDPSKKIVMKGGGFGGQAKRFEFVID